MAHNGLNMCCTALGLYVMPLEGCFEGQDCGAALYQVLEREGSLLNKHFKCQPQRFCVLLLLVTPSPDNHSCRLEEIQRELHPDQLKLAHKSKAMCSEGSLYAELCTKCNLLVELKHRCPELSTQVLGLEFQRLHLQILNQFISVLNLGRKMKNIRPGVQACDLSYLGGCGSRIRSSSPDWTTHSNPAQNQRVHALHQHSIWLSNAKPWVQFPVLWMGVWVGQERQAINC